jgi:hypothetical protein
MGMEGEALEILKMVREGQVTPEQGEQLLAALKSGGTALTAGASERPRFVRVRVDVKKSGKQKVAVNANLPIAMADLALKMLEGAEFTKDGEKVQFGKYLRELGGMDVSTILQMVKEGAQGKLVDVDIAGDDEEQVRVEVVVD